MQGEKIREYRKNLEMTQEKFAEELGVSRNTIARWERNAIQPESWKLVELALKQLTLQNKNNRSRQRIDAAYKEIKQSIAETKKIFDEIEEMERAKLLRQNISQTPEKQGDSKNSQ
jgi:DNA-binding XRE family transcriptional regulator